MALVLGVAVEGLDDLAKRALADERVDLVAFEELLAVLDDVVVVLVVEAVVVKLAFCGSAGIENAGQ